MLSGLAWSAGPAASVALGNAAAVDIDSGVLVLGGTTSAGGTTTPSNVYLFDPNANTWTSESPANLGRNGGGVGRTGSLGPIVSSGGESNYKYSSDVFQFGGADQGHPTATVDNYDPSPGGESTAAPAMSVARSRLAYATDPNTGELYAIGGLGSSGDALSSVERYDPQADAWSTIAALPQARFGASAASDGTGHILVFGGDDSAAAPASTVYEYTIANNAWTSLSPMPQAASGTAAVYGAYGQIYVIGGLTASGALSDVRIYNPVTDQWTAETPLPAAEYGAAATIDGNGSLDVVGGFNATNHAVATLYQSIELPAPVGLPAIPNITIVPDDTTYDGVPHGATAIADIGDGATSVDGAFSFTYDGSATPPVNTGTYNVVATFTSHDPGFVNTVKQDTLYIGQATPTIQVTGGGTIAYDGQPHAITATAVGVDGSMPLGGTFSYTYNGALSPPVNPGIYTAIANFAPADPNYTISSASTTISIPDPTIPTGVTATGASANSIRISWNPVAGADHYNVYERRVLHSPKGSGSTITYPLIAGNITGTSATITVSQVKGYTFYVASVSATGVVSPRSAPATGEPLFAASLASMLWNGAVTSYASVEVGQTLQVSLLGYGNEPPTYSMTSGPSTMTVDSVTGIVTYTPGPTEAGNVSATFQASNSLGAGSATFQFHVLAQPVIVVTGGTFTFDGNTHPASAVAYASDGVTPISGTFYFTYSPVSYPTAHSTAPYAQIGTYIVSATFTSSDANYGGGTGMAMITINPAASQILSRLLFYDNSMYDGNAQGVSASDAAAIATDKSAYLPGSGTATFANISSYTRGINGIMVDISGSHAGISPNDFTFKVGNNSTPSTWATAPSPLSVTVLPGGGASGSDRAELIWADNAVQNQWLEVIVAANANTGLASSDVFYFGNALADSVSDSTSAQVNLNDELAVRNNLKLLGQNIPITNPFDYNRDGQVNITDALLARNNQTLGANSVQFIQIDSTPAAPAVAAVAGISSALAVPSNMPLPRWLVNRLDHFDRSSNVLNEGNIAQLFGRLAEQHGEGVHQLLLKIDAAADDLSLDDELLDSLLANW